MESRHNAVCRRRLINRNDRASRSERTRRIQDFNLTCIPKENRHTFGSACRNPGSIQIKGHIRKTACRKHLRHGLAELGRDYEGSRLGILAISANDVTTHPTDGPDEIADEAREMDYRFPYLYDESQEVAKAYRAACTPDFYVFDADQCLVYRGQMDGSRPGNDLPVTGGDLRAALDAVLEGRPVSADQKPSLGCNIKWRAGNEPDYFG